MLEYDWQQDDNSYFGCVDAKCMKACDDFDKIVKMLSGRASSRVNVTLHANQVTRYASVTHSTRNLDIIITQIESTVSFEFH